MKKINYQFKILSALAMLFVVCGHTGCTTLTLCGLFSYDSFHMPLFLFISGYFFSAASLNTAVFAKDGYFVKQIKRLFLPWLLWNLVYGLVVTFLRNTEPFNFTMGMDISLEAFYRLFTIGNSFELNAASWFLLTLFIIKVVYWSWKKCIYLANIKISEEITLFLCFAGAVGAILLSQCELNFDFKILLIRVFYLLFWYEAGYYYKVKLEAYDIKKNTIYFTCCLMIQFLLLIITKGASSSGVYSASYPFNPIITILFAANGIAFWLRVSRILTPVLEKSKAILFLANHTFSVMMHHGFFLKIYNGLFFLLYKYTTFCSNFNPEKFRSSVWWMYWPFGKQVFTNIDVIVGVVGPCLMIYLYEKYIKPKLKLINLH